MVTLVFCYVMHFFFLLSSLRLIFFSYACFFSKYFLLVNFYFIYFLVAFFKAKTSSGHTQKNPNKRMLC